MCTTITGRPCQLLEQFSDREVVPIKCWGKPFCRQAVSGTNAMNQPPGLRQGSAWQVLTGPDLSLNFVLYFIVATAIEYAWRFEANIRIHAGIPEFMPSVSQ